MIAVFPGQGSQSVGMGKELYENFKPAKEVFEESCDALHFNLKKICFEGPQADLTLTHHAQPALLTTSLAAYRVVRSEYGIQPALFAGHSLGEYSALVAAGAFRLSDALRWVHFRGQVMQKAVPAGDGKMCAILGITDAEIGELCRQATQNAKATRAAATSKESFPSVEALVEPANFNCPGQIVISGSSDAVDLAVGLVQARKGKAIPLDVSAPFHCALMKPAREEMEKLFASLETPQKPRGLSAPYLPNRTARPNLEPTSILPLLVEQMDHAVLWSQSMNCALDQAQTELIEFGPGTVLQGLFKRAAKDRGLSVQTFGVHSVDQIKSLREGKIPK